MGPLASGGPAEEDQWACEARRPFFKMRPKKPLEFFFYGDHLNSTGKTVKI